MTPLTQTEIEELRVCIATEMGWNTIQQHQHTGAALFGFYKNERAQLEPLTPYTTSIDAIQAACLERFKTPEDRYRFEIELTKPFSSRLVLLMELTALDWCIAFARTAKIWRYK